MLKYVKLYKILNTTIFFLYISTCLSGDLWFFENVCINKLMYFLAKLLRMCKKICIFAPDFENTRHDRKTQLVFWTAF